jgi:pyridoxal phosphate enzyme (YggS family)
MTVKCEIVDNLQTVRGNIATAATNAGRAADSITLVAISKSQSDERIAAALTAGHRVFGENRVQEAQTHWSEHRDAVSGLELHLVGPLQTNKAKDAVALFDVIQTVDRPKLAEHLARAFDILGVTRRCFVQINTGGEAQKAGISLADADNFIATCRKLELPVAGLMCIPPAGFPAAPHFALLRRIAERNDLAALSMGMSADYEAAAGLGATHVRVGRGIFGERAPRA